MASQNSSKATSSVKSDKVLEAQFTEIINSVCDRVADQVLPVLKQATSIHSTEPTAKFGAFGLPGYSTNPDPSVKDMQPGLSLNDEKRLRAVISVAAGMGFGHIMAQIFHDEQLRNYMIRRTARLAGKHGGRPPERMPHILWLEQRLQHQMHRGMKDATAQEHFEELRYAAEIDEEEEDGNLHFRASFDTNTQTYIIFMVYF